MQDIFQRELDFLTTDKGKEDILHFDVPESLQPYLGNIAKQTQVTIAARPNTGKTTFALGLAVDYAMKHPDKKVILFTLEVAKDKLMHKVLAYAGNINSKSIKHKQLTEEQAHYCVENLKELDRNNNLRLYDIEDIKHSIQNLAAILKKENEEGPIDVVFLDYIQILPIMNRDYYTNLASFCIILHDLMKHYNFVLFSLSQINGDSDKREDRRPMSADIAGTSQILKGSDIVLILHDDTHFTHVESNPIIRRLSVDCTKNRDDAFGQAYVLMNFSTGRLYNVEGGN